MIGAVATAATPSFAIGLKRSHRADVDCAGRALSFLRYGAHPSYERRLWNEIFGPAWQRSRLRLPYASVVLI